MQKLILPFKKQMMLCGYKNKNYTNYWGFAHYGVDISSIQGGAGTDATIYASGEGTVVAACKDNKLGYGLAVLYKDCYNHKTGKSCNLIARYMHMCKLHVTAGQKVKAGDKLATEGKEGTGDYHLHFEFDTDTSWPINTPQVAGSNFWKRGTDSTVNPSHIFHVGNLQTLADPTYNPAWLNAEDVTIPVLEAEHSSECFSQAEYTKLHDKYTALLAKHESLIAKLTNLTEEYNNGI